MDWKSNEKSVFRVNLNKWGLSILKAASVMIRDPVNKVVLFSCCLRCPEDVCGIFHT